MAELGGSGHESHNQYMIEEAMDNEHLTLMRTIQGSGLLVTLE